MESNLFLVEEKKSFSESAIWQLNRDFYNHNSVSAFSEEIVPHNLTTNSLVSKTYAELIFGLLKDLFAKDKKETVYILELGAGHGRLAFLILTHLGKLVEDCESKLPPYCYILSDIVEENLSFYLEHPQFQEFYKSNLLDVTYYDATQNQSLELRYSKKIIQRQELEQPIVALANYFFDSIPNELFFVKDKKMFNCSVSLQSHQDPEGLNPQEQIEQLKVDYHLKKINNPYTDNIFMNEIINSYEDLISDSYLFFPMVGIQCLQNIKGLSKEGLLLLSLDKGFHESANLDNFKAPDIVNHGSFSIWVNYHALGSYCEKDGGCALFPSYSNFHFVLGSLLFLNDSDTYPESILAYQKHVDDFGPDDFNTLKKQSYSNAARLTAKELIALFRLSKYDPTFFSKLLPRLKQVCKEISLKERNRIAETMHQVWALYFNIGEPYDLAYEMAGIFYDLGFYKSALNYFHSSENLHGYKADTYYNIALSHYQLRQDTEFYQTLKDGKLAFPEFAAFKNLEKLEMS